ncbi:hypothetical protein CR513_31586, partial [Mucuna pruriens]
MIDAASGGALMDKMPASARHLISNMGSNTQQFRTKGASQPRMVNEISALDNLRLENQLTELTSLVRVCGICTSMEHPTNMCPTLQETESDYLESVTAISGYQYRKQSYQSRQFDNQYGNQPCWPRPSQGPYASQRFGPILNWLSIAKSTIPGSTIPTAAATKNATSRQLTISGGLDEIASNKQSGVPTKHELQ